MVRRCVCSVDLLTSADVVIATCDVIDFGVVLNKSSERKNSKEQ
jgi:hypothetical protein